MCYYTDMVILGAIQCSTAMNLQIIEVIDRINEASDDINNGRHFQCKCCMNIYIFHVELDSAKTHQKCTEPSEANSSWTDYRKLKSTTSCSKSSWLRNNRMSRSCAKHIGWWNLEKNTIWADQNAQKICKIWSNNDKFCTPLPNFHENRL